MRSASSGSIGGFWLITLVLRPIWYQYGPYSVIASLAAPRFFIVWYRKIRTCLVEMDFFAVN